MSKPQDRIPLRERVGLYLRSVSLTHSEQAMVAIILVSIVAGALIMHFRAEYRLHHPAPNSRASVVAMPR